MHDARWQVDPDRSARQGTMVQMEKAATDKRIRGASAACRTLVSLCVIPKSQACCTPGPLALCTVNSILSLTATQCQSVGQRRMSLLPAHEHTRSCARSRHWTDQSSSHGRHPYRGYSQRCLRHVVACAGATTVPAELLCLSLCASAACRLAHLPACTEAPFSDLFAGAARALQPPQCCSAPRAKVGCC